MTEPNPDLSPNTQCAPESASPPKGFESYQNVAETVGMIPSLRWQDNLIQAIVVGAGTLIGTIVGSMLWGPGGAVGLALVGLLIGTFLSGFVLMILGWMRLAKR